MSNKWTVLMVGEDHGILGKYMSAFDGHPDCYSRVNVISEQSSGVASQYHHRLREALSLVVEALHEHDPDGLVIDNTVTEGAVILLKELEQTK